ncbi:MAG: C-GCAxxG-C-C family protein [Syntrophobacterales bacterium]|nr:C-GCAxxG-C-C family protein [Syntrophobacterales bacterium]
MENSNQSTPPKGPGAVFFEASARADKIDQALDCFRQSFNCSQAVVSVYGPWFGLDREYALKTSAAFGGGIARLGETCGAVTGALMVIGLAFGRTKAEDKNTVELTNRVTDQFIERFKKRNFTLRCSELLGCEVGTPEGMKFLKEHNLRERLCSHFVKDAAEILEELLFSGVLTDQR